MFYVKEQRRKIQLSFDVLAFFPPNSFSEEAYYSQNSELKQGRVSAWYCDAAVAASRSRLDVYIHQFKNHQKPAVTPNVSWVALPWGHCG